MIPKCCQDRYVTVDLIKELRNGETFSPSDSSCSRDVDSLRYNSACCLRTFLGKNISSKAFYFVTARSKDDPNGKLNFSDADSNGDTSHAQWQESTIAPISKRFYTEEYEDKSVIGSPLRLQAIANLSMTNPGTSTPIAPCPKDRSMLLDGCQLPLKEARKILSAFNQEDVQSFPASTIVVLCDKEDFHKTLMIGSHKEVKDKQTILKTFRVISDKTKLSSLEEPAGRNGRGYQLTGHYRILDRKDGLGSILLEARWIDPMGKWKLSKLQSAEFLLHLNMVSGRDQSPVFGHYHQLQKVQGLVEGLQTGEIPELWSIKSVDVMKLLGELFAQVKLGDAKDTNLLTGQAGKGTNIAGMLSGTTKQLKLDAPVDNDFTDHLWCILSQCTDLANMVQCLNATFCELRKGDLRVFIHRANHTTLAKLVRQSYTGMASFPSLSGCLPLRLLTEIGLEKIRKDYYAIFINNSLCTSGQWEAFFQSLTPEIDEVIDMEELNIKMLTVQLDILCKLHHCLEIVSTVDAFTESLNLGAITRHVMNYYKLESVDESHCFTIPITALQAAPEIKKQPLYSVRRETERNGESEVVSLLSDMPFGLSMSSNGSTFAEDLKDYYMFKMQEHVMFLNSS